MANSADDASSHEQTVTILFNGVIEATTGEETRSVKDQVEETAKKAADCSA